MKNLRLAGFQFEGDNPYRFTFSKCGKSFEYNVKTGELKEFRKEEVKREFERKIYWQNWSPDGKYMVYAYKHNVYLQEKDDTTAFQLTTDGERSYSYSYQRDKDSDKKESAAITWSGNSKVFYCLRQDRRKVEEGWLIDHLAQPRPTLKSYKFPMPGEKHVFTLSLIHI